MLRQICCNKTKLTPRACTPFITLTAAVQRLIKGMRMWRLLCCSTNSFCADRANCVGVTADAAAAAVTAVVAAVIAITITNCTCTAFASNCVQGHVSSRHLTFTLRAQRCVYTGLLLLLLLLLSLLLLLWLWL
jgi:hypothetical protein